MALNDAAVGNVGFLDAYDIELRLDIERAEKNLVVNANDPHHTALECRRFAERLANAIARRNGLPILDEASREDLARFIGRLEKANAINAWAAKQLHSVRKAGKSVHINVSIARDEAAAAIQRCRSLARWFDDTSSNRQYSGSNLVHLAAAAHNAKSPSTSNSGSGEVPEPEAWSARNSSLEESIKKNDVLAGKAIARAFVRLFFGLGVAGACILVVVYFLRYEPALKSLYSSRIGQVYDAPNCVYGLTMSYCRFGEEGTGPIEIDPSIPLRQRAGLSFCSEKGPYRVIHYGADGTELAPNDPTPQAAVGFVSDKGIIRIGIMLDSC